MMEVVPKSPASGSTAVENGENVNKPQTSSRRALSFKTKIIEAVTPTLGSTADKKKFKNSQFNVSIFDLILIGILVCLFVCLYRGQATGHGTRVDQ
jgi:hypothetical protein